MATPTSRIQILDRPVAAPGKCIVCSAVDSDSGRKFVDFGEQIDWYGAVYFCTFCINELATVCSWASSVSLENALRRVEELKETLGAANKIIRSLKDALRASLADAGYSPPDDTLRDVPDTYEVPPAIQGSIGDTDEFFANLDKSGSIEGPTVIRDNAESDGGDDKSPPSAESPFKF